YGREASELRDEIEAWDRLERRAKDLVELQELSRDDAELSAQLQDEVDALERELRTRELDLLFTDPYANHDAIVSISVGQGGIDAQDWVEMLLRMYLKWAQRRGMQTEVLEASPGEDAGLKSASY